MKERACTLKTFFHKNMFKNTLIIKINFIVKLFDILKKIVVLICLADIFFIILRFLIIWHFIFWYFCNQSIYQTLAWELRVAQSYHSTPAVYLHLVESTEFPCQNVMQIGLGVPELWLDVQADKQILQLNRCQL